MSNVKPRASDIYELGILVNATAYYIWEGDQEKTRKVSRKEAFKAALAPWTPNKRTLVYAYYQATPGATGRQVLVTPRLLKLLEESSDE